MSNIAVEQLINTLSEVIRLSIENQIKLEAVERVYERTNPIVHEVYLAEVDQLLSSYSPKVHFLCNVPRRVLSLFRCRIAM
jgi:hypothetical protein